MLLILLQSAAGGATNVTASPGAGSLTLTGYAPTVTAQQSRTASPGVGTLTLTGFAPTVSATRSATASPGSGALVLTGFAPSVTVPTSVSVTPGTGALTITGYQPTVTTQVPVEGPLADTHDGIGWAGPRKRQRSDRASIRDVVKTAMREAFGEPRPSKSAPEPKKSVAAPVSLKQTQDLAARLLGPVDPIEPIEPVVSTLEQVVSRIDEALREQAENEREATRQLAAEIDEEDELLLLMDDPQAEPSEVWTMNFQDFANENIEQDSPKIKEPVKTPEQQREEKLDDTLRSVMQAIDALTQGQQQLTKVMMAPRVPVYDKNGRMIAARPDLDAA